VAFAPSFIDELIARNPIEDLVGQYVHLTRKGSNLFGLCPFHSEKTASFSVAPDKQIYYCFGCHKGGGAINFVMEQEGLDYPDAVRFLAKRAGMEVPEDAAYASAYKRQERLWALCKDAARYFWEQLSAPAGEAARAVSKALYENGLLSARTEKGEIRYFVSDEPARFNTEGKIFLGKDFSISAEKIEIDKY